MFSFAPLIVAFPLAGFLILGLFGPRMKSEKLIGIIGSGTVGLSFLFTLTLFIQMLALEPSQRKLTVELFTWVSAFTGSTSSLTVNVAYQIDPLSILMALIVTGVGLLIHIYSIGYMHGDGGFWRFFTYMNLFIFAMLNLILADNFLLMFLGWEGVGLCSYLLIGFWYEKKETGVAAKKAFIVNRIGDFGFILGMLLIFSTFGSLNFNSVFNSASLLSVGNTTALWITLLLFIGAMGKSAQIPLYVWLPDAMAGPTPVSALIHAATMVTAGVYMVARCSILFALAPVTMEFIAIIGAVTAVFAATIALVQNDIKKILAYSTISQLGYMLLAMGVAAFSAGIFHLMTHAFFKALLFLGAGAVIHGMHDEQDIQKMGGLKEYLPVTYKTFFAGALAIAGIPPFAGFFSKDEILWKAFSSDQGSWILWLLGILGAAMTAFYMFRLVTLTFNGKARFDHHRVHPHEAPGTMTIPLILLAVLSMIGGFAGWPHASMIEEWLEPVFSPAKYKLLSGEHTARFTEYLLMFVSVAVAVSAIYAARWIYLQRAELEAAFARRFPRIYRLLLHKYYVDELYDAVIIDPMVKASTEILWKAMDVAMIDGLVNGSAKLINGLGQMIRKIQTGVAQSYAVVFIGGILFVITWLLLR
ncbi:MAG: NADH-quinone oxidoreductase subunit L [Ignavibacteriae bacterium]|nr:MAG: NADH-quinone oxidoreductase subunit L [Ignavibacteriota bacterium]